MADQQGQPQQPEDTRYQIGPLGFLYPADLRRIGLTNEDIAQLSVDEMIEIAYRLWTLYLQTNFWTHLTKVIIDMREEKAATEENADTAEGDAQTMPTPRDGEGCTALLT